MLEIGHRVPPERRLFTKKWNFDIFGAAFPPPRTDWREISFGQADPRAPWTCQISRESVQQVAPVGAKMLIFWLVGKFNTRQFAASRHPAGNTGNR